MSDADDQDDDSGHWQAVFHLAEDGLVHLDIRMQHGGTTGIGSAKVGPGQDYNGISHAEMAARRSGCLIVRDGRLVICDDDSGVALPKTAPRRSYVRFYVAPDGATVLTMQSLTSIEVAHVPPGSSIYSVSVEEMKADGSGEIIIRDDGTGYIKPTLFEYFNDADKQRILRHIENMAFLPLTPSPEEVCRAVTDLRLMPRPREGRLKDRANTAVKDAIASLLRFYAAIEAGRRAWDRAEVRANRAERRVAELEERLQASYTRQT